MKITTTENYRPDEDCGIRDCERHYCNEHRLLYRDHDTAQKGIEGDRDVVNGLHTIWEVTGECPQCRKDERHKKLLANVRALNPGYPVCHFCFAVLDNKVKTAFHLVDYHEWTVEKAHDWLRDQIQKEAFYDEP